MPSVLMQPARLREQSSSSELCWPFEYLLIRRIHSTAMLCLKWSWHAGACCQSCSMVCCLPNCCCKREKLTIHPGDSNDRVGEIVHSYPGCSKYVLRHFKQDAAQPICFERPQHGHLHLEYTHEQLGQTALSCHSIHTRPVTPVLQHLPFVAWYSKAGTVVSQQRQTPTSVTVLLKPITQC